MVLRNGIEEPDGRLGAVLRLQGRSDPTALTRHGPWVVTTLEHAKQVLTEPERFDFPTDVSRRELTAPTVSQGGNRSPHSTTRPVDAAAVGRGSHVFAVELDDVLAGIRAGQLVDVMQLLRAPVARATTAAVLPDLDPATNHRVGDLVLDWIDALGPVIARSRPPARWSKVRRLEDHARRALEAALADVGVPPAATATVLAAGVQVPVAAGSWMLVALAADPDLAERLRTRPDLAVATAWETVRVYPPTWITARLTTAEVTVGATSIPEGAVVMVSPLLLGRLEGLAPGPSVGSTGLDRFDPFRWDQEQLRPGAWLPFGAGPHACPGRNLGLAQLTHLATVASRWRLSLAETVTIDQSRGIYPRPARLGFEPC